MSKKTYGEAKHAKMQASAGRYAKGIGAEKKQCLVERGKVKDEVVMKVLEEEEDVWGVLWRVLEWSLGGRTGWLLPKMYGMEGEHERGELKVLTLQHPELKLGDNGLRRVGRWLIENNEHLEGIRRIDIAGNNAGNTGLTSIANALPLSCMEVDAPGNAGVSWIKGAVALAHSLRTRGGGILRIGKAHKEDLPAIHTAMNDLQRVRGGEVQIFIFRWGAATETYRIPTSTELVPIAFGKPRWHPE